MTDREIFNILKNKKPVGKYPCNIYKILQTSVYCKKCAYLDTIENFVNNKHKCEFNYFRSNSSRIKYNHSDINQYLPDFIYSSHESGNLVNTKNHILGNEKEF